MLHKMLATVLVTGRLSLALLVACILLMGAARAQPRADMDFSKTRLNLGGVELLVEVADTEAKRNRGLMERQSLADDNGMLFIFEQEQFIEFWMKDTYIPLSVGFFDRHRVLTEIVQMEPVRSIMHVAPPRYRNNRPAKYALEVNAGWFRDNRIVPGTRFEFVDKGNIGNGARHAD